MSLSTFANVEVNTDPTSFADERVSCLDVVAAVYGLLPASIAS